MVKKNILVFGASGLVGNMVYRVLSEDSTLNVFGTSRSDECRKYFIPLLANNIITFKNLFSPNSISEILNQIKPQVVINCISVGRPVPNEYSELIPLLSLFPKLLFYNCESRGIKLINISSDGVFSGHKGNYCETDVPDADDTYGRAKILGEVSTGALTLRTSFIGPELGNKAGLLEWFLSKKNISSGYSLSIFSGITTLEFGKFLRQIVIPQANLSGIFHIASEPCSKFDLLKMIKEEYSLNVDIVPDTSVIVNRSLDASMLETITGYSPPSWVEMLHAMRRYSFGLRANV
jgi:dTDP-4-dehydrorhamnose reductase